MFVLLREMLKIAMSRELNSISTSNLCYPECHGFVGFELGLAQPKI
jgi:hypothetical protein